MKPPLFHVGQAVVCVNSLWPEEWPCPNKPQRGPVYHVRAMYWGKIGPKKQPGWAYLLEEIINPISSTGRESAFWEGRFATTEEMPAEAYAELLEALEPVAA